MLSYLCMLDESLVNEFSIILNAKRCLIVKVCRSTLSFFKKSFIISFQAWRHALYSTQISLSDFSLFKLTMNHYCIKCIFTRWWFGLLNVLFTETQNIQTTGCV